MTLILLLSQFMGCDKGKVYKIKFEDGTPPEVIEKLGNKKIREGNNVLLESDSIKIFMEISNGNVKKITKVVNNRVVAIIDGTPPGGGGPIISCKDLLNICLGNCKNKSKGKKADCQTDCLWGYLDCKYPPGTGGPVIILQ